MYKILVIGAHNDECEYGCGGVTYLLKQKGCDVLYLNPACLWHREVPAEEKRIWEAQEQKAAEILGAKKIIIGDRDGNIYRGGADMIWRWKRSFWIICRISFLSIGLKIIIWSIGWWQRILLKLAALRRSTALRLKRSMPLKRESIRVFLISILILPFGSPMLCPPSKRAWPALISPPRAAARSIGKRQKVLPFAALIPKGSASLNSPAEMPIFC